MMTIYYINNAQVIVEDGMAYNPNNGIEEIATEEMVNIFASIAKTVRNI